MYNRNDPRFRRRLNQFTQNLESANESAQVGLFSFSEHYIKPCFGAVARSIEPCTTRCFSTPEERKRRRRARSRGRPEHSFDFYDDWEDDENDALLSLENDEFDRVMGAGAAGVEDAAVQPVRQTAMGYGSRDDGRYGRPRRRSIGLPYDDVEDPTVIPTQSRLGFLSKLPFRIGGKGLRYTPSAADLQERPRAKDSVEGEDQYHDDDSDDAGGHGRALGMQWSRGSRKRDTTAGSGHTTDSYSSRGDIFPSDDEADAVPLGDEFAVALERRTTHDESSSGRTGASSRRPGTTRTSTRTMSSRSSKQQPRGRRRKSSGSRGSDAEVEAVLGVDDDDVVVVPTMADLKAEELRAQAVEEEEIERKREAAIKLAKEKGFPVDEDQQRQSPPQVPTLPPPPSPPDTTSPVREIAPGSADGFPFPTIEMQDTPRDSGETSARSSADPVRLESASTDSGSRHSQDLP